MLEQKSVTPLKVGILVTVTAYFLFTLHANFTLAWIGEWNRLAPEASQTALWIMVTDVSAGVTLIFRFIGSIIAFSAALLYFAKKGLPQSVTYKVVRLVLIFEAIYWLGLLPSGVWGMLSALSPLGMSLFISTGIPCIVSSIAIPVSLFILAAKISPNKPLKPAIKWGWIAGVFYVIAFWLNNMGMWITTIFLTPNRGIEYLTSHPEYLFSFTITIAGLLALAVYAGYSAKKATAYPTLKLWPVGVVATSLGLYFLWNYLAWIFFGGWNDWYAWFLGHNLDLWMLTLPLVGLPLLFQSPNYEADATYAAAQV